MKNNPLLFKISFLFLLSGCAFSISAQRFHETIQSYLQKERAQWQLTNEDVSQWTMADQYDNQQTGITYSYLHQQVSGIRIYNAVSTMAIRDGKVVYFANRFQPDAMKRVNALTPSLSAEEAISHVAQYLGLSLSEAPHLIEKEPARLRYSYTRSGISKEDIKVELVLVNVGDEIKLAWNVIISPVGSADWWNIRIDAVEGTFLEKNNWTAYCSFGPLHNHSVICETETQSPASVAEITANLAQTDSATYHVYELPLEAPNAGDRTVVRNPHSPISSPYGWHDTDGNEGAEYTITRGNNVYVYDDRQDLNEPGYSPDGGAALNFDFPIDLSNPPVENQDPILTNLFYTNNMIHDILYLHGFDESSGNFQETNYTGQGQGGDFVRAEGQDGGGINNANFATPEDGNNGRMQMYLWNVEIKASMEVHSPANIAGLYFAVAATFGPYLDIPVTGYAALVVDDADPVHDACSAIVNADDMVGKIAVIDRGNCTYSAKVQAAAAAGAIAVIVVNSQPTAPLAMGGAGGGIPAVMISQEDGELIKSHLNAEDSLLITLALGAGEDGQDRDGSLDNGIIAHEYGHGLSNRLTGGPSNTGCLSNAEQGGEGWSDWLGLILTIEPGDLGTDPRPIGTYVKADDTGTGIRRYPYSTDMTINPQTYGDLVNSNGVHAIGEIWSTAIWEVTWALIDLEGFDPDWYNGEGGNITAMRLVLEGMKLQGCNPGYIDARDAILAADDILYDGVHKCLLWEAFAKRGMGAYADQGSASRTRDETEDFSMPNICLIATVPPSALFEVDAVMNCFGNFRFTDLSTDIPQYYAWDFGDGSTSTEEDPQHSYEALGVYTVSLIVTNNVGADTFSMNVFYEDLPVPEVSGNLVVCEGSYTTLVADVLEGYTASWHDSDSTVYVGKSFRTAELNTGVTYSVQQIKDVEVYFVGPANNSFFAGSNHNTGFEGSLLFETYKPLKIMTVLVYAEGEGDRTIKLSTENGEELTTRTVFLSNGANRVTLDMDIPEIGKYQLSNVSENLYRNNGGANYPYKVDDLISIYSSNATNEALTYYYYFYDWEVQETGCVSASVEIAVEVEPGPFAGFLADAVDLAVAFTDISAGDPTDWSWDFGDGSPKVNFQNPNYIYAAAGIYNVVLTVSNGSCFSVYEQMIEVGDISSAKDLEKAYGIKIYPNPASDVVHIEFLQTYSGRMNLVITNSIGEIVGAQSIPSGSALISVKTNALTAGMYQFQLVGEEGREVQRVTITR